MSRDTVMDDSFIEDPVMMDAFMVYMGPVMVLFMMVAEILGGRLNRWWERRQDGIATPPEVLTPSS
jgi:hypothetical protein